MPSHVRTARRELGKARSYAGVEQRPQRNVPAPDLVLRDRDRRGLVLAAQFAAEHDHRAVPREQGREGHVVLLRREHVASRLGDASADERINAASEGGGALQCLSGSERPLLPLAAFGQGDEPLPVLLGCE